MGGAGYGWGGGWAVVGRGRGDRWVVYRVVET